MDPKNSNIEIVLPKANSKEIDKLPVWDAYIDKIIIDGDIPDTIRKKIYQRIHTLISVYPLKFSGKLKGNIENILTEIEVENYNKECMVNNKLRIKREGNSLVITLKDKRFYILES